jgi:multidrug efflux pump subunit AcrA (membrane-fusion protein)
MAQNARSAGYRLASDPHWHFVEAAEGKPVILGGKLDPVDRTAPLIFEVKNDEGEFRAGQSVTAQVYVGEPREVLVVPASAVVEEDGLEVVYVQRSGEAFERRAIKTGTRYQGNVEVMGKIEPGEWVVSTGAFYVRLAAMPQPAQGHGHAH